MKLWPKKLGTQLVIVTTLAVVLSNGLVAAWFEWGNERNNRDAQIERLLDRAASIAVLMSNIPVNEREPALHAISTGFASYYIRTGKFSPPHMNVEEANLAARLKTMLPGNLAKLSVTVRLRAPLRPLPDRNFRDSPPPDRGFGDNPPPPRNDAQRAGPPPDRGFGDNPPLLRDEGQRPNPPLPPQPMESNDTEITVPLSNNTQLVASFFRPQMPIWSAEILLAALVAIIVAAATAIYISLQVARPLSALAQAASAAARGGAAPRVPEVGPDDVRNAAIAFNAMNDQVTRTLESQRQLLSAVGHDLRTPITAMRINIEFVQDQELAERLQKNLDELQDLTEAVLSAARGTGGEASRQVDLAALVESVCADLDDLGEPVTWKGHDAAPLCCRSNEIHRAVRNVIENAVTYGRKADVSIEESPDAYEIVVEDEGPGIPEADRDRVFEAFVRLESSRNEDTGGAGLGLTLVKAIVDGHGGKVVLEDRLQGGLRVRLHLPRDVKLA